MLLFFFRARFYAAEIASAIGYLHALSIIYRYYFTWLSNCYVIFIFAKTCPQHLLQPCFLIIGVNLYYVHFLVMFCYHLFRDLKPENILLDFRVSMFCFTNLLPTLHVSPVLRNIDTRSCQYGLNAERPWKITKHWYSSM